MIKLFGERQHDSITLPIIGRERKSDSVHFLF
jgi:hypothetical protein